MKIDFDKDINGFQNARKLKMILEHYKQTDIIDKSTHLFIDSLLQELSTFLACQEFVKFNHSKDLDEGIPDIKTRNFPINSRLSSLWQLITGPSKRELLLSRQRQELIERAERAEAMTFEAFAETAEIGKQRDEILEKLAKLESDNKE